ncbi:MAG: asparaginase [Gemmatimonadota bacterium]|nr:asparaginase [Gemmatimonadota bacterium]
MSFVEVSRGEVVESRHRVHVAVADADGRVVATAGSPDGVAFFRSVAKPFQALPLVEEGVLERFGLTRAELALCCASHEGEPLHLEGARSILSKAGAREEDLRCGPHLPFRTREAHELIRARERALPVHNNCSGKHAGMVALAAAMGWPVEDYHRPDHPVQRRMLAEIARWTGVAEEAIAVGVDGCGVSCFGVPLPAMAGAFGRFTGAARRGEAPALIVEAMTENPFMVGGTGRACTRVMERTGSRAFVKLGAEGMYGGGLGERGLGFILKIEDGARRACDVAVVHLLGLLGALGDEDMEVLADLHTPGLVNTRGEDVGRITAAFDLTWA